MTSEGPLFDKWTTQLTGVACFVRDCNRKSYFIRVFDIDNQRGCVFDQEIYVGFEYKTPRPYFHTFEADVSHMFCGALY